ncbi:unnamed protein product [Caenorhabditis sp. 36 PRJEB53466]|nr:unnamed protein product [Caenorhabditis sp. 36 PRJEB53466]
MNRPNRCPFQWLYLGTLNLAYNKLSERLIRLFGHHGDFTRRMNNFRITINQAEHSWRHGTSAECLVLLDRALVIKFTLDALIDPLLN